MGPLLVPLDGPDDGVLLDNVDCFPLHLKRGQTLFRPGDKFAYLYAVRSGFFKSFLLEPDGREQVQGFSMPGDVLGLDGASGGCHGSGAMALEAGEVLAMPFAEIESKARYNPALQRHVHALFARQMVKNYSAMVVLGTMSALERVATFLMRYSERCAAAGGSPAEFDLPMTRCEIGSYLGLTIETVSRVFSALARHRFIDVSQKHVRILHAEGLQALLAQHRSTMNEEAAKPASALRAPLRRGNAFPAGMSLAH